MTHLSSIIFNTILIDEAKWPKQLLKTLKPLVPNANIQQLLLKDWLHKIFFFFFLYS